VCRLNARLRPLEKEALDAFVAEALDHRSTVSRTDTRVNRMLHLSGANSSFIAQSGTKSEACATRRDS
jgi:hypothetical protein